MADAMNKQIGTSWLKGLGYDVPDTGMAGHIAEWFAWMCATTAFYDSTEVNASGTGTFKVERITLCPGKMICEDWASIVFNEETVVSLDGAEKEKPNTSNRTNDWLQDWLEESGIMSNSKPIERAFGVGTAAWVLGLNNINEDGSANPSARVTCEWYDARNILPLSWTDTGVTAAAFMKPVVVMGKTYTQINAHVPDENGFYHIHTAFFQGNGHQVMLEGFTEEVATYVKTPTFALFSPDIDNTYHDHCPFGVSVLDRCTGAIKLADGSFDNMWKDVFLGQKMVMLSESLIKKDDNGNYMVPRSVAQQVFLDMEQANIGDKDFFHEYNPDLRVEDNRKAISTGLAILGKRAGFGFEYYSLEKEGGIKTAKEVAQNNAELMRNAHKHEKPIESALITICTAAVALAKQFIDTTLEDIGGRVNVNFGDTVIEDDSTERENDRADVAAGLLPKEQYIMKYHAVDEETAKAWALGDDFEVPEV